MMESAEIVDRAFRASGSDPRDFAFVAKPGPPSALRRYQSDDAILTIGVQAEGQRLNRVEWTCRTWAANLGIPVPTILDAAEDGAWMLARRVRTAAAEGQDYVSAALDVADTIRNHPAPVLDVAASQWRGSRASLPARIARSASGGLNLTAFLSARRAAGALSDRTTSHGDFYRRNVLCVQGGGVSIVDWEFCGLAARWTDHVRLWSTLRRASDRDMAWQRITDDLDTAGAEHLSVLVRWMTLRLLAENLAAPVAQRHSADLSHARVLVSEGRRLSASLR